VPSYCDRILWHIHKDAFTDVELNVELERYGSIDEYTNSDHKPVIAELNIQVNISIEYINSGQKPVVTELNIQINNSIEYTIRDHNPVVAELNELINPLLLLNTVDFVQNAFLFVCPNFFKLLIIVWKVFAAYWWVEVICT